jgi:Rieske Fe-S protein
MSKSKKKKNISNSKSSKKKCKEGFKKIDIKGKLFCVGKCPHSGGPIFYNPKEDELLCPWHNSKFDTKGKYKSGPANGINLKISK